MKLLADQHLDQALMHILPTMQSRATKRPEKANCYALSFFHQLSFSWLCSWHTYISSFGFCISKLAGDVIIINIPLLTSFFELGIDISLCVQQESLYHFPFSWRQLSFSQIIFIMFSSATFGKYRSFCYLFCRRSYNWQNNYFLQIGLPSISVSGNFQI